MMDIPMINQKETRRALYAYLAVYRRFSYQLINGIESRPRPAKPGYEDCLDPDLIRRTKWTSGTLLDLAPSEEIYREWFVDRVDYHVGNMAPYEREIIIRRLLHPRKGYRTINDLLSDDEVLMSMKRDGWVAEHAYYDERKAHAILDLAERLRIAIYYPNRGF